MISHLAGGPDAELELALTMPARMTIRKKLGELAECSEVALTGRFTSESILVHRLVTPEFFQISFRVSDRGNAGQTDWYYVRVQQANGYLAWSSPVWAKG